MIDLRGASSCSNGIEFVGKKYTAKFVSHKNATKISLKRNKEEKISEALHFLQKIPFIRGIVSLLLVSKPLFSALAYSLLCDIWFHNSVTSPSTTSAVSETQETITSPTNNLTHLLLLLLTFALLLICVYTIFKVFGNPIKTVKYHGAEHKIIYTYYDNKPLTLENSRKSPRINDECGTMLLSIGIFVYLSLKLIFSLLDIDAWFSITLLLTIVFSSEIHRLNGNTPVLCYIYKLGYLIQKYLVTMEPTDLQLIQGIETFKLLERAESGKIPEEELKEMLGKGMELSL